MVVRSLLPDVEIPSVSVYEYLFGDIASDELDRTAVVDGVSGAETTFRSLLAQIDAVAGAMAARGFGVGDVVALHAPNVPAYVTVFHGLLRAGVTVTTVNGLATGPEITKQLVVRVRGVVDVGAVGKGVVHRELLLQFGHLALVLVNQRRRVVRHVDRHLV